MKAITFDQFGSADVLKISEVAAPQCRPNDLLVRTRAAGVNRADLTHRRGGYGRPDFGDSTLMGLEIAGDVIAVGEKVQGYNVGDRVMGIVGVALTLKLPVLIIVWRCRCLKRWITSMLRPLPRSLSRPMRR